MKWYLLTRRLHALTKSMAYNEVVQGARKIGRRSQTLPLPQELRSLVSMDPSIQPQRPLPAYYVETEQEQEAAEVQLKQGKADQQVRVDKLGIYARAALTERSESDVYQQNYTVKWEDIPSTMDYKRGSRTRGSVAGYRYHEGALKTLAPRINSHKKR
jgi:hypothetical protein